MLHSILINPQIAKIYWSFLGTYSETYESFHVQNPNQTLSLTLSIPAFLRKWAGTMVQWWPSTVGQLAAVFICH